jgi:UDPglucose 6-dehydrogenase
MDITVIGAGYVGLVSGTCLAQAGHHVTFVERRLDRLQALQAGVMPISEPGLGEAFERARSRIRVSEQMTSCETADLVLVAVGTPVGEGGRPDLSQMVAALDSLRAWPETHVMIRSTLPPGSSDRLPGMMGRTGGERLSVNPEFLRQGAAMSDFMAPSRIVVGRYPETLPEHLELVERLYASIEGPRLVVSTAAAELIKNVSNAFLALKLSFVNEVASLSEEYEVDVDEVLAGIALDPRIGSAYMKPGLGFGGSCLPKELEVVASAGRQRGLPMHLTRAAAIVNGEQQDRFGRRIVRELGRGSHRVALLGLSFKADTDDLRGSPALGVARHLVDAGFVVVAHDPVVTAAAAFAALPAIDVAEDAYSAVSGADAIVVATDWPAYAALDWARVRSIVARPLLYDGRNMLDRAAMRELGFAYRGVGRNPVDPHVAAVVA